MIKYSIITVCKNSEKTIARTIESVLNQTLKDYEYIIVDGSSTDNTLNIVNSYKKKFKGKMKIISEKDDGIYDALNKGIRASSGNWIGVIMSQDWYDVDALENIDKVTRNTNDESSIVYGMCRIYSDSKLESIVFNTDNNFKNGPMMHEACFVNRSCYENNGLYELKYKYASDLELIYRNKSFNVEFIPVEKVLVNFSLGGVTSRLKSKLEGIQIRRKYGYISNIEFVIRYIYFVLRDL